jgi:hypothetical protein
VCTWVFVNKIIPLLFCILEVFSNLKFKKRKNKVAKKEIAKSFSGKKLGM